MRVDGLTAQQNRVAELVALGESDKQIAVHLGIAKRTANAHVLRIAATWQLDPAKNLRVQIARRWLASQKGDDGLGDRRLAS
jgi:DNA-binding NarL/FixJ family response regulator